MTQYHVNAEDVAQAGARVTASAGTIRAEVATLMGTLTHLESTWQGGASRAFAGIVAEWRTAQTQLETALEAISTGLARAAEEYSLAESQAMRLFAR